MVEGEAKYVGVDGCKGGWFSVGLDNGDDCEFKVFPKFDSLLDYYGDARLILVDIPIGLPKDESGFRPCDLNAREQIGSSRAGSVFAPPARKFVHRAKETYEGALKNGLTHGKAYRQAISDANDLSKRCSGKGISPFASGLILQIADVDFAMAARDRNEFPRVREAHPEVCFWAINNAQGKNGSMTESKKDGLGFLKRLRALQRVLPKTEEICHQARSKYTQSKVASDDMLDAIVLAVTAQFGCQNESGWVLNTLPDSPPTDSKGLPMEMVYVEPQKSE